jgi:hypothetical protein
MEKILRFEEKLRHIGSGVLYPNILGSKWKDKWEREKRWAVDAQRAAEDERNRKHRI